MIKSIDRDNTEEVRRIRERHNEVGDSHCRSMDIKIFKYLGVNSEEALEIYKTLNYLDLYDLKVTEKKQFQKDLKVLDNDKVN